MVSIAPLVRQMLDRARVVVLDDLSVLIFESEYLIALEIQRILETLGVRDTAIVSTAADAQERLMSSPHVGAAIVSGGFDRAPQNDLLHALRDRGIAFVVITAYPDFDNQHPELAGVPIVQKPFADEEVVAALLSALAGNGNPR